MATSGTYTFSVTRDQIIQQAMKNLGMLYEGETPTAQETSDCAFVLNMLVKQWQAKQDFAPGLKVWTRTRGELYLSSTTGQYNLGSSATGWGATHNQNTTSVTAAGGAGTVTLTATAGVTSGDNVGIKLDSGALFWTTATLAGSVLTLAGNLPTIATAGAWVFNYTTKQIRPELIETAVLRDTNYNDVPLDFMTLQEYETRPAKTSTAYLTDPSAIYYEYRLDGSSNGVIYTDAGAAADTSKHIHMVFLSPVMDFNVGTDNPQFPQAWYMALCWGLAEQITPMFNRPWTDLHATNKAMALAMAKESFGETSSLYFQPGAE